MKSPAELTELFRERGLKVTPQRQCIFRLLHRNDLHPTAEAVYAAAAGEMPTISLKTVYSTLHDLAAMGELQQLDLGTGATRFDPNLDAHHHLLCTSCGRVRDVEVDAASVRVTANRFDGFTVTATEVVMRGRCHACVTSAPSDPQTSPQARSHPGK